VGVCPTPIFSPVAKGHAPPCPRPPKGSFIPSINAVKAWQIGFMHHKGEILPLTKPNDFIFFCMVKCKTLPNIKPFLLE
jgi:hypothetical protein